MKLFIKSSLIAIVALFVCSSCAKTHKTDDADAFVGLYEASIIENSTWGNSSGTITSTGKIYISKVSSTRILATGSINTYGAVVGSAVYFEPTSSSDSYGYINTAYQAGTLSGDVLLFNTVMTGQLANNGVLYPFSATCSWTCIKQP